MVYTIVVPLLAKEDQESINKLSAKLVEASQVYSKDKETLLCRTLSIRGSSLSLSGI